MLVRPRGRGVFGIERDTREVGMGWSLHMSSQNTKQRRAFSLAEMMIALAILGFGLLVVGAAIPVGLSYNRQSTDLIAGGLAADSAQDLLEQRIILKANDRVPPASGRPRVDPIFRPRDSDGPNGTFDADSILDNDDDFTVNDGYEPLFKVRPFLAEILQPQPATPAEALLNINPNSPMPRIGAITAIEQSIEPRIASFFVGVPINAGQSFFEYDFNRILPVLSAQSVVYPPVDAFNIMNANNNGGSAYRVRDYNRSSYATEPSQSFYNATNFPTEMAGIHAKLRSRRIVFTSFYRRVFYDDPGPDGRRGVHFGGSPLADNDNLKTNPNVYEMIVVAYRLPTPDHRFPVYEFTNLGGGDPNGGFSYSGYDSITPVPQLLCFDVLPPEPFYFGGPDDSANLSNPAQLPGGAERRLNEASHVPAATLRFVASEVMGELLPVGSVFIPARNDHHPSVQQIVNPTVTYPFAQTAGFIPHSPSALPIYEVVERNQLPSGQYEVFVENNGFYPWVNSATVAPANRNAFFPVWVVPPAYAEANRQGRPIFSDRSNIVSVSRRTITLPEVQ